MATIDVKRSHTLDLVTAKARAETLAKDLESKLGITWRWEGDVIKFSAASGVAKGATGSVSVNTTQVRVEIDLPFLLRAMKGSIRAKVDKKLDALTLPAPA
jgi:putative polyhydroxyalkanoate system protein